MIEAGKLPDEPSATAEYVEVIDNLFNIFKRSGHSDHHEMQRAMKDSPHHDYLVKCAELFAGIKATRQDKNLPCMEDWCLSIAALQQLWQAQI